MYLKVLIDLLFILSSCKKEDTGFYGKYKGVKEKKTVSNGVTEKVEPFNFEIEIIQLESVDMKLIHDKFSTRGDIIPPNKFELNTTIFQYPFRIIQGDGEFVDRKLLIFYSNRFDNDLVVTYTGKLYKMD